MKPFSFEILSLYFLFGLILWSMLVFIFLRKDKNKTKKAIPGVIVGTVMTGIIGWGISSSSKCKEILKKDSSIEEMVFCKYSKKTFRGNGPAIATGFVSFNDTSLYFTTDAFIKPIPIGTPIIVRYSPECRNCYNFLWDSIIIFREKKVIFQKIKLQGINCEIEVMK